MKAILGTQARLPQNEKCLSSPASFRPTSTPPRLPRAIPLRCPSDNLVQWISLRFAAAAHTSTPADDPETELRQIPKFLADIVSIRRGDLVARRIQLEQRRLALEETKNQQTLEKLFWEWTQRPEIRSQLFPDRDPDKMRNNVLRLLDHHLLGVRNQPNDPEPDPAAFI